MDFLRRSGGINEQEIKDFLGKHFQSHRDYKDPKNQEQPIKPSNIGYQLNPHFINIKVKGVHKIDWFECSHCGRLTPHNFKDICPQYRCSGKLSLVSEASLNGYYQRLFIDPTLIPIKVKEHTAQLSPTTAKEYQQDFVDGKINVLSSSTTFEMGVDVGELDAVFMRNMPPSPANYIQRAGRAGRRLSSAAFALTFCRLASHDIQFFNHPEEMIQGVIFPPLFKLDNEKIVRRHIYATVLAGFWRLYPDMKKIIDIFSESRVAELQKFALVLPSKLTQYIRDFVPQTITREQIMEMIDDYARMKTDAAAAGLLIQVYERFKSDLFDLVEQKEAILSAEKNPEPIKRLISTLENENLLQHFSRNNLIPKYGFPVDTVELRTDLGSVNRFKSENTPLRLQRDLLQAIADYAPDSEVVANGKIYISRYIRKPPSKNETWRQNLFSVCKNPFCGTLNFRLTVEETKMESMGSCISCGSELGKGELLIEPRDGFIIDSADPVDATTRTPKKGRRSQIYYSGRTNQNNQDSTERVFNFNSFQIAMRSNQNDELAVTSRSAYFVCPFCGYSVSELTGATSKDKAKKTHKNHTGRECTGNLLRRYLGHTFRTDVLVIQWDRYFGDSELSLLYAFLEGASRHFHIDRDDIDGCLYHGKFKAQEPLTTFILFDSVPGGAGHCQRIGATDQDEFRNYLESCLEVVTKCFCGEAGDGNAACYGCLCNYRNQFHHDNLNRRDAKRILEAMMDVKEKSS